MSAYIYEKGSHIKAGIFWGDMAVNLLKLMKLGKTNFVLYCFT
jgi:hypothetical protein